jgi:hypothetical protein
MMTQTQVLLDANLVESLRQVAAEKGMSLDQVLDESAQEYIRQARRIKLRREQEAYRAMHAELKSKYLGESVAIYNGALVDHAADTLALLHRVRQRFGTAPVLFCEVEDEPEREYMIRSPRLDSMERMTQ